MKTSLRNDGLEWWKTTSGKRSTVAKTTEFRHHSFYSDFDADITRNSNFSGKVISKNNSTCENAVVRKQGSCTLRVISTRKVDSVACFKHNMWSKIFRTSNFYIIFIFSNRVLYDHFSIFQWLFKSHVFIHNLMIFYF